MATNETTAPPPALVADLENGISPHHHHHVDEKSHGTMTKAAKEQVAAEEAAEEARKSHEIPSAAFEETEHRWSLSAMYHRYFWVIDVVWVAALLGWWIGGLIFRRHDHWIQNTLISWFFLGLVFFKYVPTTIVSKPVGKVWQVCVADPFFKLPYYVRLAMGWLSLLGLVFGSAYGFDPVVNGSSRGERTQAVFGLAVFVFGTWCCSKHRMQVKWQPVILGLALQQIIAMFVLKSLAGFDLFKWIAFAATDLLDQSAAGGKFFFSTDFYANGFFFVNTLGAVIWFIAFVQLLYYVGVMQWLIKKFAWFFFKLLGVSGAEAVVASASPFIGQGESACLIGPFLEYMTPSEIHQAMTSGFSTISGSVFLAYVNLGVAPTTLITSSVMSIPASIALSKLRYPELGEPLTAGRIVLAKEKDEATSALHAFSNGAWLGLRIAGLILANVFVTLSLLSFIDGILTYIGKSWHSNVITLEFILGYVLYPVSWLLGCTGDDILRVSSIIGVKIIANEFVAYERLVTENAAGLLTDRGFTIASYAVCGFGNISSLGIQLGVLSGLANNQKAVIARVGPSALITGIATTLMTAAIAGMLV